MCTACLDAGNRRSDPATPVDASAIPASASTSRPSMITDDFQRYTHRIVRDHGKGLGSARDGGHDGAGVGQVGQDRVGARGGKLGGG